VDKKTVRAQNDKWETLNRQVSAMPYDPKAIANYFLTVAEERGTTLTPMKIQKLVYFANGWHLAIKDTPLINEQVEAWPYGPVIPSLYRAFKRFGDQPITGRAIRVVTKSDSDDPWVIFRSETEPTIDEFPEQAEFTKAFLDRIWDTYGRYTAIQLSNETHQEGSPWYEVLTEYRREIPKGTDIPPETMKRYFRSLARPKAKAQ
jgi:uncharacterized phage-associated protein